MDWNQQRDLYLTERIQDQIKWYEKKSGINKKWYYVCRVLTIGSGALIPLLVGYAEGNLFFLKYLAGLLGVVVGVSEGILSLKKYRENWSIYRMTAERLNRERLLFTNNVGDDYNSGDETAFKRFVLKSEQIMSTENEDWSAYLEATQKQ